MEAFVKSAAAYKTIKKATVVASSLVVDALDYESSSVTVRGSDINRSDAGNWLLVDGQVFLISNVKPGDNQTVITLDSPLDAFSRPLELETQPNGQTVGAFIARHLQDGWTACDDPAYAMPYLVVSNSDTTPYAAPETDNSGCFDLPEYCRLMRKSYRTAVRFSDGGSQLLCSIETPPATSKQVSFDDGHSQLASVAYSFSGLAKITAIHDIDTGEKDSTGNPVYIRERSHWYLSDAGDISQLPPDRRAPGEWGSVYIKGDQNVQAKVTEAFAKNKTNHKLEFWSDRDLPVQADCTFFVYGELLRSYISYKRKSGDDSRFYYKSGELATTATEKLKGVIK